MPDSFENEMNAANIGGDVYAGGLLPRTIALVGLMGAGKSTVGKRLAQALGVSFCDADDEIEVAAGRPIADIFKEHGEEEFRAGERRVIARLLQRSPHILATGGGAFMNELTRDLMRQKAITIWLKADLDTLMNRVQRRNDRPLLQNNNPRATMERLMEQRYPIYATADIVVESVDGPHLVTVDKIITALQANSILPKDLVLKPGSSHDH
jgi:shikimate kinase